MKLYLVQHGEAEPKEANPDRPLTEQGKLDVERIAVFLKGAGVDAGKVIHSGKLRAEQTAGILADACAPKAKIEARDGIAPNDEPGHLAEEIQGWGDDTIVVGHLPYMSRLASLLITGASEIAIAGFKPGSVVCLERPEGDGWSIGWMLRPELMQ